MIGARVFMTKANNDNVTDSDPRFPGNVFSCGNVFLAAEHLANAA